MRCACDQHGSAGYGRRRENREAGKEQPPPAELSAQGKYLAVVASTGAVDLWDMASFTLLRTIPGQGAAFDALAFLSDGRRLAGGAKDGSLRIWDVQNGQVVWSVKAHAGSVGALAFSPDGRRLVSGSDDKTLRIWMN